MKFPLRWTRFFPVPAQEKPKASTRTVSVDEKRRAAVISRHAKWRTLTNDPHHLESVTRLGPLSELGLMTQERLRNG